MISTSFNTQLIVTLCFVGVIFSAAHLVGVNLIPVVVQMEAAEIDRGGSYFTARIFGRKIRNCSYIGENPYAVLDESKLWSEDVYFEYLKDRTPDSSKPMGKHDFGYWQWNSFGNHQIAAVKLVTRHDCNGKVVFTTIGPFY